jgi:acetylornithine deacetylase/succinyl-diaminopimelate desuccinylase-like protein
MTDVEASPLTGQTVELLQTLIRNQCVNDGTPTSGEEVRNSDTLETFLEGRGADIETYEPTLGRKSIVARIEGTDPDAPSVCWMGHTDVVPVSPEGWSRDPFGGELVDGEVWGRGAVDMLNVTSSMAVAFAHLLDTGIRPKGDLIYLGVADEEAGGVHGAEWLCDHEWDAVGCDYLLTEMGGFAIGPGPTFAISAAEKGLGWTRIRVKGTPGHGSAPLGADNALVKAAEVVRRLDAYRPDPMITDTWRAMVGALALPDDLADALTDPGRVREMCEQLGRGIGSFAHACTHTTFSPNVIGGGSKTNVIPDSVDLDVDIRILPGETFDDVDDHLQAALGDLYGHVETSPLHRRESTASSIDTPMWAALEREVKAAFPTAKIVPNLVTGGTDSPFFREKGTVAYGAALFSDQVDFASFASRFHGHDERVDVTSLGLTTNLWVDLATNGLPE